VASTYHGVGSSDNMRRGKTEQPGVLVDSTPRLFALLGALGGTLGWYLIYVVTTRNHIKEIYINLAYIQVWNEPHKFQG